MSVAPSQAASKPSVSAINTPAGRAAAAQAAIAQQQQQEAIFNKASTPANAGRGFGSGRVSFDRSGNTLQDGRIVQFAGRQAQESYLAKNPPKPSDSEKPPLSPSEVVIPSVQFPSSGKSEYDIIASTPEGRKALLEYGKTQAENELIGFRNSLVGYQNAKARQANNEIALGNALISLSNKQIAAKNLNAEKQFTSYITENNKAGDAVFLFYSGNKQVGQSSGARTYHDFLKVQKEHGSDISIEVVYPSREKTLTEAVSKNTAFYAGLPQSYWTALGKSGYLSERNVGKVNEQLSLYGKIQSRENLASAQGFLFAQNRGGEIKVEGGRTKIIGPAENEVSSFLKFPFIGQKRETSFIPSTSFFNVIQFLPGIPVIEKLPEVIGKIGTRPTETRINLENRAGSIISSKAFEESANFQKTQKESISLEPRTGRQGPTYRAINMMRENIPSGVFERDITEGRTPISARPNIPRNTLFEDITKQMQTNLSEQQRSLLTPTTPKNQPPASPNLPFFPGRLDQFGRQFSANKPPVGEPKKTISNEAASVFGKSEGIAPITTRTEPTSGLSPISREYFGVQFTGTYPTTYLPPVSGFATAKSTEPILPEFANPLGRRGNPPIKRKTSIEEGKTEFYSDILSRRFRAEETLTSAGKPGSITSPFLDITKKTTKTSGGIKSNISPTDLSEFFIRPGKIDTERILGIEKPSVGEPKGRIEDINRAFNVRAEKENPKETTARTPIGTPEAGKFVPSSQSFKPTTKEIGLDIKGAFTETKISLGKGIGFTYSKGGGTKLGFDINKPTNPSDAFGPKGNLPKRETKGKGSQILLLETKPVENIVKTTGYREDVVPLGTGKGTLIETKKTGITTKTDLANKQYLDSLTGLKARSRSTQQYEYGYEFKPVPATRQETGLILGSKLKSSSLLGNLGKSMEDLIVKPKNAEKQKQSSQLIIRQKSTTRQKPSVLYGQKQGTSPKQSTSQTTINALVPQGKQTQSQIFAFKPYTPQLQIPKNPPPTKTKITLPMYGPLFKTRKGKGKEGPTALIKLGVSNVFSSSLNIKGGTGIEF